MCPNTHPERRGLPYRPFTSMSFVSCAISLPKALRLIYRSYARHGNGQIVQKSLRRQPLAVIFFCAMILPCGAALWCSIHSASFECCLTTISPPL